MKQFIVDRHTTPNTPTLEQVPTEKIPVYNDLDAAAADIANLAENQIIATHDEGSELSAPVDVVQSGNMHAVTSNASYKATKELTSYNGTYCKAYKVGRVCTLMIYYNSTSGINSPATIETLPADFRPVTSLRTSLTFTENDTYAGNAIVKDNGEVVLYHESGTQFLGNKGYGTSITYITAN